ncbi:MAG: integrin, partial [Myxococcales bacterium]|nr:integrin [Myxococcales bacterium]
SLTGDGDLLAVGARGEASNSPGIDGDQTNDGSTAAGAVYVFERDDAGAWSQRAYIKSSSPSAYGGFGYEVSLAKDGRSMAVGAFDEAATLFERDDDGVWSQHAILVASKDPSVGFGTSVSLAGDGRTLAVGNPTDSNGSSGIDPEPTDAHPSNAGAAYVFVRDDAGVWSQDVYIKPSNTQQGDWFGWRVVLSGDGNVLAVCSPYEDGGSSGIDGDQYDDDYLDSGATYVFVRDEAGAWSQRSYVKASTVGWNDYFGVAVSLSTDGRSLVVSGPRETSSATGIGGDQSDGSVAEAGAGVGDRRR